MNVRDILGKKPRAVYTCQQNDDVGTACDILTENNVGALVVLNDDEALVGIFSERDLARVISAMRGNALVMPVSEFMTTNVVTVGTKTSVSEARKIMKDGGFRHLPVIDEGKMIGIISISDILEAYAKETEALANHLQDYITGS